MVYSEPDSLLATTFVSLILERHEEGKWDTDTCVMRLVHVIGPMVFQRPSAIDFMRDIIGADFQEQAERDA